MIFRAFGITATLFAAGLALASCSSERQVHWGGAMLPIDSIPVPDHRPVVVVGPAPIGVYGHRHVRRTSPLRRVYYYSNGRRYWRVINDPAPPPIVPKYKQEEQRAAAQASARPMSAVTGTWAVAGDQPGCRLSLTNVAALGVQKATSTGCKGNLSTVTGWRKFGKNGIEVLQPGNKTAAKFVESGDNRFDSIDGGTLQLRK